MAGQADFESHPLNGALALTPQGNAAKNQIFSRAREAFMASTVYALGKG